MTFLFNVACTYLVKIASFSTNVNLRRDDSVTGKVEKEKVEYSGQTFFLVSKCTI